MYLATLKKKAQAIYQTQNHLDLSKKEVSYCSTSCKNIYDKPAYVNTDQTFTGTNTFSVLPKSSVVPSSNDDLVNKFYVDNAASASVTIGSSQTITGLKTFSALPQSSVVPSSNDDLVNKSYTDSLIGKSFNLSLTGNTDISNNTSYKNSTVRIASNGTYILTVSSPTLSLLSNSILIFQNDSSFNITLRSSTNFQGKYGSNTFDFMLPENSWVKLFSNGSNWIVNEKSPDITYQLLNVSSGTSYATNYNYLSSNVQLSLSGASSGTITWMSATAIQTDLTTTKIYNVGTNQITLNSSGGNYTGKYGSGTTSLIIPANTWVELFSTGSAWQVNNRSAENQVYTLSLSENTSIANNNQYINSILRVSTSVNSNISLTLPECNTANTLNQKYTIYNTNGSTNTSFYNVDLSGVATSYFKGVYQDNAGNQTSYPLLPNGSIEFYSNGTNWVVTNIGRQASSGAFIRADVFNITRPFKPSYLLTTVSTDSSSITFDLPVAVASDVGCEFIVRGLYSGSSDSAKGFYLQNSNNQTIYYTTSQIPVQYGLFIRNSHMVYCSVLQSGFAGGGTLTINKNANSLTVNTINPGTFTFIPVGATLTFTADGTIYNLIISATQTYGLVSGLIPWGGRLGGVIGPYAITTIYTGPTVEDVSFTSNNVYNWFIF